MSGLDNACIEVVRSSFSRSASRLYAPENSTASNFGAPREIPSASDFRR